MRRTPFNPSEWKIMGALWEASPATVREVRAGLAADCDWAYSTVKTLLDRLAAKGAVAKEPAPDGPGNAYRPLVSQSDARREAADALASTAFGGEVSDLMHFLVANERLSRKERTQLRRLLESEDEPA